jgi:hypothetical protein
VFHGFGATGFNYITCDFGAALALYGKVLHLDINFARSKTLKVRTMSSQSIPINLSGTYHLMVYKLLLYNLPSKSLIFRYSSHLLALCCHLYNFYYSSNTPIIVLIMAYSFFSNFAVALVAASFIPLIYSHPTNQRPGGPWSVLHERDEVNPVAPKFMTKPDPDMPPLVDFSVMSKYNLSSWDDEALALTSKIFLPGQFQARVPIANGYV